VATLKDGQKLRVAFYNNGPVGEGGGLEHHRTTIMRQARTLWNKWRGEMKQLHLKNVSCLEEALSPKNVPKSLLKEDWEWLVLEHYTDPDFQVILQAVVVEECYNSKNVNCIRSFSYNSKNVNCRSRVL